MEKLSELFCAVLCTTVVHNDTHTYKQFLKLSVGLRFRFSFCMFVEVEHFVCVFWFTLGYFVLVLFAFVLLGLIFSVLS